MQKTYLSLVLTLLITGCAFQQKTDNPAAEMAPESLVTSSASSLYSLVPLSDSGSWSTYVNPSLGFSMKIPKIAWNGKTSSDIVAIEDPIKNRVFITTKEYYDYPTDSVLPVTLQALADPQHPNYAYWTINRAIIKNDLELDSFLKKQFGSACSIGAKEPTDQTSVLRVVIKGDGKSRDVTKCDPGDNRILLYVPSKNELFYWLMGNGITFAGDQDASKIYDSAMRDSFQIL